MTSAKSIYSLLTLSLLFAFFSCHKKDSFTEKELRAKLYFNDSIQKKDLLISAGGTDVLLSGNSDFTEYLYKTKTDSEGNFAFSYQPAEGFFYLLAKATKDGISYTAVAKSDTFSNKLILYPVSNNAVKVIARSPSGNFLQNATICIFNSSAALNTNDCSFAIRTKSTNENGVAFFNDLIPNTYYILARATLGSLTLRATATVVISSTAISVSDMTLVIENGFNLNIIDNQNTPVNSAQVYGYRSRAIFLIDSTHTSSILSTSSNTAGNAAIYNIDPARYYLRVVKQIGTTIFKRMDSVDVNTSGVTNKTIQIN